MFKKLFRRARAEKPHDSLTCPICKKIDAAPKRWDAARGPYETRDGK